MRIISWNVNSVRARIENLLEVIRSQSPDVLLLQETKVKDELFPREFFEDAGYNLAFCGEKINTGRNGVAILSKHMLEEVKTDFCEEARYIEAYTGGMFVASVYVPNGQEIGAIQYNYKLEFLAQLKERLLQYKNEIFVIGGDFNVAPHENDTYLENYEGIMCSPEERRLISEIREAGFADALADKGYTWWDYRRFGFKKDNGFRLDHFYLSLEAQKIFSEGEVVRFARGLPRPSDHAPIQADFNA